MRLSNSFFYTIRENIKDEDSTSGNLLVKGGFIKKTSAGVYMMLPLGLNVQNNIEEIIRKHINKAGGQEIKMPALIAQEYYEKSGRVESFGNDIYKLKDRNYRDMILGPTHEELFVYASKSMIKSYKNLPFNLYQFQNKYRDEPRARFGLIRVKEFVMKDAYTFDENEEKLNIAYQKMFNAYKDIFDEIGIDYKIVKADTGVMGGLLSEEFQAISDIGEDQLVFCDKCDYSTNLEIAEVVSESIENNISGNYKKVETNHLESIEEVSKYLNKTSKDCLKAMIMNVDDELVCFFIKGNREFNKTKALKLLNAKNIDFANEQLIAKSNLVPGYAGPIGLSGCKIVIDKEVLSMSNFITGANEINYHFKDVNINDFKYDIIGDVVNADVNDICPVCGNKLNFKKGIEIGNTFKLGTKYTSALDLKYLTSENKEELVWMGSYGIGIGRVMASVIEQNHDDKGIIWPINIAPYKVIILVMNVKDELQVKVANQLYEDLNKLNIECILDDRNERPGIKFNDADLIGIPFKVTVGKKITEDIVEIKSRNGQIEKDVYIDEIVSQIQNYLK